MGRYINRLLNGHPLPARGKADALIQLGGATEVDGKEFQPNLVCVVDNHFFEAAGYAYSEAEYKVFCREDGRPKRWLTVPYADEIADY